MDTSIQTTGIIFDIQKYSVHDGPGIRTVLFLKGCPLRCLWCSNPESHDFQPELTYNKTHCLTPARCGACLVRCLRGALAREPETGFLWLDRTTCARCLQCAEACPAGALAVCGRTMSVREALNEVEKDSLFYARSRGGLTLSGGEPLAQPSFSLALLQEARARRIPTAMETCGWGEYEALAALAGHLDFLLYDIKVMDGAAHKAFTGADNGRILENFRKVRRDFPRLPVRVRTPVVPACNDSEEAVGAILDFLEPFPDVSYELLPYHRFAQSKYLRLGRPYPLPPDLELGEDRMRELDALVRRRRPAESARSGTA